MAFSLTAAYAYPLLISSPTADRKGNQVIELQIAGTGADVDLDIGDLTGTFWSAADDTAMGAAVLAQITTLYPQFDTVGTIACDSPQLLGRLHVATLTGAGQYTLALDGTTKLPNIAFNAADGESVIYVTIVAQLESRELGMTFAYPA